MQKSGEDASVNANQRTGKNGVGQGTKPNAIADYIYTLLTVHTVYFQATISHGVLNEVRIGVYIIGILTSRYEVPQLNFSA